MTITINEDCVSTTIVSENFDPTNLSVVLTVTINCDEEYIINAEAADEEIIVSPATLGLDNLEVLDDGVYYFELAITQEDGTVITESGCRFINCTTTCLMLDSFKDMAAGDEEATIRALSFYALDKANGCTSCACSDLCLLYNATQLDNCTTNVTTCGCS